MPDHTSWFTYLMSLGFFRNLERTLDSTGFHVLARTPATLEYTTLSVFVILVILLVVMLVRPRFANAKEAVLPEPSLTLSGFVDQFVGIFYGILKEALGPKDAKFFLPVIGTCALFIFFSNALGLVPGFAPPTGNLNVTFACGIVVFLVTHYYGFKRQGAAYLKHFIGPVWWLAPLMIVLETISHLVRPVTLGIRLMVNMTVDHVVVGVFTALVALLIPVPIMVMGVLVVTVQTYVFCLLSTIYIQLAIEHHDEGHEGHEAHGHEGHAHGEVAAAAH